MYSCDPIPIDVRTWDDPNAEPIYKTMEVEFLINNIFKCFCIMPFMDIKDAPKAIEAKIMEDKK